MIPQRRTFLVVGATSGVGLQVAWRLHRYGHQVLGVARRSADFPGILFAQDASTADAYQAIGDFVSNSRSHPLGGIFHGAGAELVRPIRGSTNFHLENALDYVRTTHTVLRLAAAPAITGDGASVVVMSSVAAHRGVPGLASYAASRAAAEAMVRVAAAELAPRRIRVNAIAAGGFHSPLHDRLARLMTDAQQADYEARHPLGLADAATVAEVAVQLLCSQPWTTGSTVVVDGGYLSARS